MKKKFLAFHLFHVLPHIAIVALSLTGIVYRFFHSFKNQVFYYINAAWALWVVWILFPFDPSNTASFVWDFGDGNTSTEPFPTNVYDVAGTYTVCLTVMANGCVGTTCLTFTVTPEGDFLPGGMPMTGFTLNVVNAIPNNVSEVSANAVLEAYPCPFNEELTLNIQSAIAGNAQVACYDMTGALIAQEQFVVSNQLNTYSIPTSSWSNGAYTIVVSTPSGTIRRVVMK